VRYLILHREKNADTILGHTVDQSIKTHTLAMFPRMTSSSPSTLRVWARYYADEA